MSKVRNLKKDLQDLPVSELEQKVEAFRRELFSLRLQAVTTPAKDYKHFSKLRKDIARALTYLKQKNQANVE